MPNFYGFPSSPYVQIILRKILIKLSEVIVGQRFNFELWSKSYFEYKHNLENIFLQDLEISLRIKTEHFPQIEKIFIFTNQTVLIRFLLYDYRFLGIFFRRSNGKYKILFIRGIFLISITSNIIRLYTIGQYFKF